MARPLIVTPAVTSTSRTCSGGGPILAMPSPERSTMRRAARSGRLRNAACAARSASPIAVSPLELRRLARTLAAKAAALAWSETRVQSTVTTCLSRSDHSSTSTSIAPLAPPAMAAISGALSKARAMPSCWSSYSSASTLSDTSTARTRARSTVAARAGMAASREKRRASAAARRTSSIGTPCARQERRPVAARPEPLLYLVRPARLAKPYGVEQYGDHERYADGEAGIRHGRVGHAIEESKAGECKQEAAQGQAKRHDAKLTPPGVARTFQRLAAASGSACPVRRARARLSEPEGSGAAGSANQAAVASETLIRSTSPWSVSARVSLITSGSALKARSIGRLSEG